MPINGYRVVFQPLARQLACGFVVLPVSAPPKNPLEADLMRVVAELGEPRFTSRTQRERVSGGPPPPDGPRDG